MVRHRALAAAGGLVHKRSRRAVGLRRDERGRAAAVQAQRRHAAELDHALGDLRQRRADGIAALAAVDGVHHKRAVALEAHSRARRAAVDKARADLTVFDQLIERADHVRYAVPLAAARADGDRDAVADLKRTHGGQIALAGLEVDRQHILPLADGGVHAAFDNVFDPKCQLLADAQLTAIHRTDNIKARLARADRAAGIEAVVIQEDTERRLADIVHGRDPERAAAVGLGVDAQVGLAHHRRAVVVEAEGIIAAGDVAENALAHHAAERDAVGGVVIIAVDARDHAVAVGLQRARCCRDGRELRAVAAATHNGLHACVGRVDHIILLTKVGVGIAPERTGVELGALIDLNI